MITVSAAARAAIDSGTFTLEVKASAWLGDELLADDVPIDAAVEDSDRSLNVPERVVLTVPKRDGGTLWTPRFVTDPLSANGQTLRISLGVGAGADGTEWFQRGEFVILESPSDGDSVRVTAVGMPWLIQEADFVSPFQPSGTLVTTLRSLLEPALTINLDNAPPDRAVPAGINWDSSRIAAMGELLDAWPALARMNELGYLEVVADYVPTYDDAQYTFADGAGGTMVEASGTSTRDGAFNVVVATGNAPDGTEVRGVSSVPTGPWAYPDGPANPLAVPFGYASPLLTTQWQAQNAADTVLRRKMREAVLQRYTVTCVPDPTVQLGDACIVTSERDGIGPVLCTVETLQLPYKPDKMVLGVVSTV